MQKFKRFLLLSLCLNYSFIAHAGFWDNMTSWWAGGKSAKAEPIEKPFMVKPQTSYESVDAAHKDFTDQIRQNILPFKSLGVLQAGDSAQIDYEGKKIKVYKPTLEEREIMIKALHDYSENLPDFPENIVDLIYVFDAKIHAHGFYKSEYDRIFISKNLFLIPSKLVTNIIHEYTHYQHYWGHKAKHIQDLDSVLVAGEKLPDFDVVQEEKRADTYAVKRSNCVGCAGEILRSNAESYLDMDEVKKVFQREKVDIPTKPLSQRVINVINRNNAPERAKIGYIAMQHYLDPEVQARMSKGYCPNCLVSVKNRLKKTPGGISALEERRAAAYKKQATQEEANLVGDEMLDYPVSSKAEEDVDDAYLY